MSLISNGATQVDYQPARVSRPGEFAKGRGKREREKRMLGGESEKKKRDL